jgi:hypothetical protein
MKSWARAVVHCGAGLSLLLSSSAWAKPYKSGELETTAQYGFGAFEARVFAATGPGVISTFFLWRPGSDTAPAVPWHEIDFEIGLAAADFQTQIMTPGDSPPQFRTEHPVLFNLPSRPWQAYYTYRIEWTPTYIAFFVDGTELRRETDPTTYGALFDQDASGNTPANERMEIRTGVWPGDPSSGIAGWSGTFDGTPVPTGHFVDYIKAWAYTPGQANPFSTLLLDEEFNTVDFSKSYTANWTFNFSESDYIPANIGALDGFLTVALTTAAGQAILPNPPPENALIAVPPPTTGGTGAPFVPPPPVTVLDGLIIQATAYDAFFDTTAGNMGDGSCSSTDVDAQVTSDPNGGGGCNVGWTDPGEWLDYDVVVPADAEYDITARIASLTGGTSLHLEVDGVDVSGPLPGPGLGWQSFVDAIAPAVALPAGSHVIRIFFDTGNMNVHYLAFALTHTADTGACEVSCDDGNPCTTDTCDPVNGCQFQNNTASCADDGNACTDDVCAAGACTHPDNTASCADDGNACTNDVCAAGVCTHPANGTCSTGATPCSGLCANPTRFTSASFASGNLGSGATCFETTASLNGGVCGNLSSGRTFTVNQTTMSCTANWPNPLPAKRNGGYCIQTTAGNFPWAYFTTW